MPRNKDRSSGQPGQNDQGRNMRQQRMWSPSHKTGRGGGNRK
jgi:hypothetical protein